ncbi:unnamed protein product [Diplocarpon coronariae]|uniref:PH domain-containing protein n=1 Tax=Diplocarpon coronariae TaxID=2795749 RepID=A0A218ZB84_9HELO|nr:hypothetical protein JHW43_005600 [Diplocarpon mali]OWP05329.1 hypothetical protein B2J93_8071 [Marssonina coronariae]
MAEDKEAAPVLKYSRYRSVRQAAKPHQQPRPEPQPVPQKPKNDISRTKSMARYRRSVVPARTAQIAGSSHPPVPDLPGAQQAANLLEGRNVARRVTEPARNRGMEQSPAHDGRSHGRDRETEAARLRMKALERERQLRRVEEEKANQARLRQQLKMEEEQQRLADEETERLLAEQKRKDLQRLQAELDAAPPPTRPLASPKKEKFAFFSKKRGATRTSPPTTAGSGSGSQSITQTRSHELPRSKEGPRNHDVLRGIEQGGGGIVPRTDAPLSASNAGERRVLVRCNQSSLNLPITPETTPVDIIYASASIMPHSIVPSTAILLESYLPLGLERRVRRYEHIRDIMNSWDRDTQNALLVVNSESPNYEKDLEAFSVPREAPGDVTVLMYHSQKPGKWNKRYIHMLSSGQVFTSKNAVAKMTDKESLSICHLSDFDIYNPTPQQIRKSIRPPRKHCFAVKSQQKTVMFLSTENFVHFFSSDNPTVSEKFYAAVQVWRSWYLVNKMGVGKKEDSKRELEISGTQGRPSTRGRQRHSGNRSVDESPSAIASSTPPTTKERFRPHDSEYDSEEENKPRQIPFHLRNSISLPPNTESRRYPPLVAYKLPPGAEDEFASSGLLGRTYSQRVRVQKEREDAARATGPFAEGTLLQGPEYQRTLSMRSAKDGRRPQTSSGAAAGDLQRRPSQKVPKPLLDFTPQFKEAPQWDKKNRGHGVAGVDGVPLVEIATTPDTGLGEMPRNGTVFRRDARPTTSSSAGGPFVKGGLVGGR